MMPSVADSPIAPVWGGFAGAPFQLAPERKEELQKLIADRNIQFNLDAISHELRFEGASLFQSLGLVFIGLRGLERLWAHAYGAIFVYRQFQAAGFQPILLPSTDEGKRTERLIGWALEGELRGNTTPWPIDLPRPQANPADEQHQLTNELFWGIGGFAVLHEIGHIVQSHSGNDVPKDVLYRNEFEADEWAYDWIMHRWREYADDVRVAQKRVMLVGSMFAIMAAQQVYAPRKVKTAKHPNTIDRLLRFLVKHANEDNGLRVGLGWAVPSTTIHLHLSQRLNHPLPQLDSFRTYLNTVRAVLDDPVDE